MKIRNKIFILILSLIIPSLVLLIFVVSTGLEKNMMIDIENKLMNYKKLAEVLIDQNLNQFTEGELRDRSREIADELSQMFNLRTSVFSQKMILADSINLYSEIGPAVSYALKGETAYRKVKDNLYFAFPVGNIGAVRIVYSLDTVNTIISQTVTSITVVILVLLAIAVIGAGIISGKIAGPISRLNRETGKIKTGNYDLDIAVSSSDEIGELTSSFIEMSEEIKNKINQLEDMVAREKKLKNMQRDFLNSVTHEFKTPLTSIIGYADLLKKYKEDEVLLNEGIGVIRKEGERLYRLVEKVLYLSRMERYNFEPEMEEFALSKLVEEAVEGIRFKADQKGIGVSQNLKYTGLIKGDFSLLYRMMINLLDNAVKYSKEGGQVKVITDKIEDKEGYNQARIILKDNGIGISQKHLDKIFQPFYREDKGRSRKIGGDGLGLSIVMEIVKKHGGEIKINSKKGEGTEIIVIV